MRGCVKTCIRRIVEADVGRHSWDLSPAARRLQCLAQREGGTWPVLVNTRNYPIRQRALVRLGEGDGGSPAGAALASNAAVGSSASFGPGRPSRSPGCNTRPRSVRCLRVSAVDTDASVQIVDLDQRRAGAAPVAARRGDHAATAPLRLCQCRVAEPMVLPVVVREDAAPTVPHHHRRTGDSNAERICLPSTADTRDGARAASPRSESSSARLPAWRDTGNYLERHLQRRGSRYMRSVQAGWQQLRRSSGKPSDCPFESDLFRGDRRHHPYPSRAGAIGRVLAYPDAAAPRLPSRASA